MHSAELGAADLRAILDLLGAAHETVGAADFMRVLMTGLATAVPCDLISYNEIDLVHGATQTYFEPAITPRPQLEEAFARYVDQHPLVREYAATRDPSPLRMSDFISVRELRRLDLYHEVFRPLETTHQLAFSMAIEGDRVIGIGLNRRSADFSDREFQLTAALQPHLAAAADYSALRAHWRARQAFDADLADKLGSLTNREQQVALLLADGRSNRAIARALGISDRTAEKHVANLLHKLGLGVRSDFLAWLRPGVADARVTLMPEQQL